MAPHGLRHLAVTGLVWVDAIATHQLAIAGNALEQPRNQCHIIGSCKAGKDGLEAIGVVGPQIRRQAHSDDDELRPGRFHPDPIDDALQVALGLGERHAIEAVVASQLQQKDIYRLLQYPVDAPQASGGGLAGKTGIHNPGGTTNRIGMGLHARGKAVLFAHTITGGQTVTEE